MGLAQGQCGPMMVGKFCRGGTICREIGATAAIKAFVLSMLFLWHTAC
jgi:hypothetical protein